MNNFFSKQFYGNTLGEWLFALMLVLFAVILGRIIYWFFTRIVRIFTQRTKTKLDDIIIDKIEEPIVAALVIAGAWYGISFLNMPNTVRFQLNGLVGLAIILDVAWLIVRTVDALIEEYIVPVVEKSESNLDDAVLPIARRGFSAVVWIVAVVVGLNNAGYDVATILAGLGIGGLALAIGARTTIMNVFGGLTILINQPFKIEDRIQIDEHDGYVEAIGLSNTRLRTFLDNYLVTIPNRIFTDREVVNVSAAPGAKADLLLHLPIDTSPEITQNILEFLKELALTHPEVNRECRVTIQGFDDYSLVIKFVYYIKQTAPFWDVKAEMNLAIMKFLRKHNISLAVRHSLNLGQNNKALKNNYGRKLEELLEDEDEFS